MRYMIMHDIPRESHVTHGIPESFQKARHNLKMPFAALLGVNGNHRRVSNSSTVVNDNIKTYSALLRCYSDARNKLKSNEAFWKM